MVAKREAPTAIKMEATILIKVTAVGRLKIETVSIGRREIINILEQMNKRFNGGNSLHIYKAKANEMNLQNFRIILPKETNFCQV